MHYNPKHVRMQKGQTRTMVSRHRFKEKPRSLSNVKRLICFFMAILVMASCMYMSASAAPASNRTASELQTLINQCIQQKETAHQMAECARALGYPEDHIIIKTAGQKWKEQNELQIAYTAELKAYNEKMAKRRAECPAATQIYEKLREYGLSHVTTCAILGSSMLEVGGNTLEHIDPYLMCNGYYGAFMWSIYYNPGVLGRDLNGQLEYLINTMPANMKMFGGDYEYFKSITDVGHAARYFNIYYERGSGSRTRIKNAQKALEYYS